MVSIVTSIFEHFPRNMMIFHIIGATFFLILWQLETHNILKTKKSELIFGICAILYGILCIYYYVRGKIIYSKYKI